MTQKPLTQVITRQTLKLLAGGRSFSRGEEYHNDRLVSSLELDRHRATARVQGTRTYTCELKASGESLQGDCTCPAFNDSGFCKHLVAVGLAIIEPPESKKAVEPDIRDEIRPPEERARRHSKGLAHEAVSIEEIREYLSDLSREKLVETLIAQAMHDSSLLRALRLEILCNRKIEDQPEEQNNPKKLVEVLKIAIDQGVELDGDYDEWPDEYETAKPLQELLKKIHVLLKDGIASEVIELAEYFIAAIEPILERFHEGHLLHEMLEELQEIHLIACKEAKPEPEQLARRLFRWELTSGWGVFENAPTTYESVLGEKGLATYTKLAQAEWDKVPEKKERDYAGYDGRRYKITRIMENLAKLTGDIGAEVAIHAKNLTCGYDYLKIAELYASRKLRDQAVEWAEKGLQAHPDRPDGRLRELLAKEYHRLGRHDEAMALTWAEFIDHPSLGSFQSLKANASVTHGWPEWRKKAIGHVRAEIQKARAARRHSP